MDHILIGKGEQPARLLAKYGNRHGLVAGATGTGKTISLLVLAEGFSRLGVPVFMPDVKGMVNGELGKQLGNQLQKQLGGNATGAGTGAGAQGVVNAIGGLFGKKKKQ